MKKLTKIQRLILKDLFKARGKIDSYTLFRRYYITPRQLAASISKFIANGHMEQREGELLLTAKGKLWLVEGGFFLDTDGDCPWKIVPNEFRQVRLPSWLPYAPELDLLDRSFKNE